MYNKTGKGQKEKIDFSARARKAREERLERIQNLRDDIVKMIDKNKIDYRDAKPALRDALSLINAKSKLTK